MHVRRLRKPPRPMLFRLLRQRRHARRFAALTYDAALARASRGASLLDDRDPGWAHRVDSAALHLSDGAACVM